MTTRREQRAAARASNGPPTTDLIGRRFGRLVVQSLVTGRKPRTWQCVCDCGRVVETLHGSLWNGMTSSCGCFRAENPSRLRHGHGRKAGNGSPEFRSWRAMVQRCTNKNHAAFARYGGRGISICQRWRESFEAFLSDMGPRPEGTTLDRFPDPNGNYEPGNCRWATAAQQNRNTRSTVITEEVVRYIHARCEAGESRASIAEALGLRTRTVDDIRSGRRWKEFAPAHVLLRRGRGHHRHADRKE